MNEDQKPGIPQKDPDEEKKRRDHVRRQAIFSGGYLIIGFFVMYLFQQFVLSPILEPTTELTYSEFRTKLAEGEIVKAQIGQTTLFGEMKNTDPDRTTETTQFTTVAFPAIDTNLVDDLQAAGIEYGFQRQPSNLAPLLLSWALPLGLLFALWYFFMRRIGSTSGGGIFGTTKSKATEVTSAEVGVTFNDVGGVDEAITELQEIIQFLKYPERFARLGGRIPKGVLLVGPPGTGKTLLAKAVAGEANVPFFQSSGSEFVEMYVGVGAARVRDLFEQARKAAPALVFIDEIDAIGQARSSSARVGGHDEREQTLNQLLSEVDGFKTGTSAPVIIMAASNRPEILDPALLRAGRFDRQITVSSPDLIGRRQILKIHSQGIKLAEDFNIERAARITSGFSGADIENVINEAALLAARREAEAVETSDFEDAIERVVAGLEKRTRVMNEQTKKTVAYHESGHALVAELVPNGDPVSKISIVPRTRGALGYTMQMPAEDRYLITAEELEDRIAVMMGGRAAEQTVFGKISTGASDDIMRATALARRMVTEFGMSETLGSVRYAGRGLQYLDGTDLDISGVSPKTAEIVDAEIQRIVTEQYERAQDLLFENRQALENLTQQLLEQETVDGGAVKEALDMKEECLEY
jgi:cell division protease FtsH